MELKVVRKRGTALFTEGKLFINNGFYCYTVEDADRMLEGNGTKIAGKTTYLNKDGSKVGKRFHHGLIAQEVEALITETGIDFGGFQNHSLNGGSDVLSIGYDELIAPLIKAVQELSQRVKVLESK
jgi:hypothetical protein